MNPLIHASLTLLGLAISGDLRAQIAAPPTASDWGGAGLLQTPSARMTDEGELSLTASHTSPYSRYTVALQPLPWLEGAFRYVSVANRRYGPESLSGSQNYKDKSIDVKVRLLQETRWWPDIALGARDVGGTGLFASEYLVASKRFGPLDTSLGLATGYIGKVLVIFGGTSGIGAEMKRVAEAYQAKIVAAGTSNGVDITDLDSIRHVLETTQAAHGRIDYIVNSAGILHRQALIDMASEDVLKAIQVNYIGAVNVALAAFDHLRLSQGQLLNFTSSSYTYGRAMYSLYSSSKAAIVNLTQALADEWHSRSVRVNCINPERTATPMRTRAFGVEPEGSLLSAREVAEKSLLVLLSEYTGQIFDVKRTK